jgi:signal peptidase II
MLPDDARQHSQEVVIQLSYIFHPIGFIIFYFRKATKPPPAVVIALGMQLGGAIGNLTDRIRLGYVVDFIDFRFWPIFNAADSSISLSLILLAVYLLYFDKSASAKRPAPAPEQSTQPTSDSSTPPVPAESNRQDQTPHAPPE